MKFLFRSARANLLSTGLLVFLFLVLSGPSATLAGGLPSKAEKEPAPEPVGEVAEPEIPVPEIPEPEVAEDVPEPVAVPRTPVPRYTIGFRGALGILNNADVTRPAADLGGFQYEPSDGALDYRLGYSVGFLFGYAFENGLRLEGEALYMNNSFRKMDMKKAGSLVSQLGLDGSFQPCVAGAPGCVAYKDLSQSGRDLVDKVVLGERSVTGDLSALGFLVNAYYDIDFGSSLVPYVGGGLGMARFSSGVKSDEDPTAGNVLIDGDSSRLIYQVGGGVGYRISGDVTVSLDYRYLDSFEDLNFRETFTDGAVDVGFGAHYVGGGIRIDLW